MAKKALVETKPKLLFLQDFLDSIGGLSSGQTLYYTKTYGVDKSKQLTSEEWSKLTTLKKKS